MIEANDKVVDVIKTYPGIETIFSQMGISCSTGCLLDSETVGESCEIHREDITVMLGMLNRYAETQSTQQLLQGRGSAD